METSILKTVKKLVGVEDEYTVFDTDLIVHINTALMSLIQLGVGPSTGFVVTGTMETWKQFLGSDRDFQGALTYVYLKVKLIFDPPATSFAIESMNKVLADLEWRLNAQAEGAFNNVSSTS